MRKRMDDKDLPPVVMPSCEVRKTLSGQKALVTGANSGIGKGVALALGLAGADVVVNYVSTPEQAEEVVAAIRHEGGNAYAHQADVSQEDQVQAMFARMIADLGTIDVLVNNVRLQKDARVEEMTLQQWNTVLGVNLTGQFLCARGGQGVQAARRAAGSVVRGGQDHLHQLGARGDPGGPDTSTTRRPRAA
jgi:NAD(P)-dependent dehydrogenase (short-subunit alcohol dehydrogenase family)